MTEKEIIEGNKLIAEFMGGYFHKDERSNGGGDYNYGAKAINKQWCAVGDLKYHSSWDWMMPVVDKIEWLKWTVVLEKGMCQIYSDEFPNIKESFANKDNNEIEPKIKLCWKTIVEFIKWYNQQPK